MNQSKLFEATRAYQAYLELRRQRADQFDDAELEMLDEDVCKAREEMEIAWLEYGQTRHV